MKRKVLLFVAIGVLVLSVGLVALAQEGYDLSWWTADGGGVTYASGGGYSLGATAGQADAGVLNGGGYTLAGGFWHGGAVVGSVYHVYLPLVMRAFP